jgi:cytochrome c peroxidase
MKTMRWLALLLFFVGPVTVGAVELSDLEQLGQHLFFDMNLSVNGTQSCASCHAAEVGLTGPDSGVNEAGAVIPGVLEGRFGNRKPPSAAYGGGSPPLYYDEDAGGWFGGMFWDGRATGWTLGDPLAEQAMGPFLNPLEMGMPNDRQVCIRVANSSYAELFQFVWGSNSLDCVKDAAGAYERIALSIAAYEKSTEVNPFTSKFDLFWDNAMAAGNDVTKISFGNMMNPNRWQNYASLGLTSAELQGLAAFNDPNRGDCVRCHSLTPGTEGYPLFTDFSYWNIGVPRNPANPFYTMPRKWNPDGADWVDYGLGGFLKSVGYAPEDYVSEMGKFKTPTLRNVDLRPYPEFVKAYGHNGFFKSLEEIILFYTWRAHMEACAGGGCGGMGGGGGGMGGGGGGMMPDPNLFPSPEVSENLETLKFSMMMGQAMMDQANILALLKTLSDGYEAP